MNSNEPVSVELLRNVVNHALDQLQDQEGDALPLNNDFFWSLPSEATYDIYTEPAPEQLTVGQLTETWDNLARLKTQGGPMPPHALVWIADILKAVAHQSE